MIVNKFTEIANEVRNLVSITTSDRDDSMENLLIVKDSAELDAATEVNERMRQIEVVIIDFIIFRIC